MQVAVNNRTDMDFENVRVFLCIHYTDMYKDEYDVIKVPLTKNVIAAHETFDFGTVKLNYQDKKYKDVTRVRAILMTDDRICWIDDPSYKRQQTLPIINEVMSQSTVGKIVTKANEYLSTYSLSEPIVVNLLKQAVFPVENTLTSSLIGKGAKALGLTGGSPELNLELPRILTLLDPQFSINQLQDKDKAILPTACYLAGSVIKLNFDYKPKDDEIIPLYVYSNYINFRVDIQYSMGGYRVKGVSIA
jgi:hypothetical protein